MSTPQLKRKEEKKVRNPNFCLRISPINLPVDLGAILGFELVGGVGEPSMRGSSSQQQQQQQQKDLSVYDFNAEDFSIEEALAKYRTRSGNFFSPSKSKSNTKEEDKEDSIKYNFLQAFSGLSCKQIDVNSVSCIDLHENGSPQGSSGIDSPERNLVITDEKSELDENMTSSASYEEGRKNVYCSEVEPKSFVRVDSLLTGATGSVIPSVGNEQVSSLQSDGTPVDVISDNEESCSSGSVSSASDHVEHEDYLKHSHSNNCFTRFGEQDKDDLAVAFSPDYVIYQNSLYGEAELLFFPDSVLVKFSDISGNNENFVLECAVADIIHVDCQWSASVGSALVKFHMRETTVSGNENIHNICDPVELIFADTDISWLEKELKVKSLGGRYGVIWNVSHLDRSTLENDARDHDMFFPRHYFTEIPDSFEDVIYPKGDPDPVSISKRDIELLQPDTFINDTIIDFYIKYLKTKIPPNEGHRFHFFNSFFFRKLADLDKDPGSASEGRAAFLRVRKWTRKVNIFEKDYIFIPVNFNLHWSLLVICQPGEVSVLKDDDIKDSPKVPCILHMDSIKGSHSGLKNLVQSYLLAEWKERHPESAEDDTSKFSNLRFVSLELPQQENSFDCGLFLLHYVELFLEGAPHNFNPFKISKFSRFLTANWFIPSEASFKRSLIRKLIYDLLNDSSQNVTPTSCSKGHLSSGYHENNIDQKPAVEFLNRHCGPSKSAFDDSTCSIIVKGIEMNLESISSPGVVQGDKQERLVMHEFLEPGRNSMSLFQEDAPFRVPKCETCPTKGRHWELDGSWYCRHRDRLQLSPVAEHADESKKLITTNLVREDVRQVGESSTIQTCSISFCLKDVGEFESSMLEREEIGSDLLPKPCNHVVSNQCSETGIGVSVSVEGCGYVPDSPPYSYLGENLGSGADDPQQMDANKTLEDMSCKNLEGIEGAAETKGDYAKCEEINTAEDKSADNNDHQKRETTENVGKKNYSPEINTCNEEALVGEDCRVVDATDGVDTRKDKDCQDADSDIVVDATDGIDTRKDKDCQDGVSDIVVECELSCPESSLQNSKNTVIFVDEKSMVKHGTGLKREEPGTKVEVCYQKRRKVFQPDGERKRTRSFSRESSF